MFHFNSAFFTVLTAGVFLSNACGQSIGDPMEFPPDVFTERIEDGYVDVTLTLDVADHTSAAGTITNTRLFNGMLPGPTIRIFPGETLRVNFINNLVEKGTPVTTTNVYSHPEDTNLHYHGAHVSGELPSDDVTLTLSPGDSYNYESYFPDVHVPGTLWVRSTFVMRLIINFAGLKLTLVSCVYNATTDPPASTWFGRPSSRWWSCTCLDCGGPCHIRAPR